MAKAEEGAITRKDLDEAIEELAIMTNTAIENSVTPLRESIGELQTDVSELKSDVKELRGGMQAILKTVQGIDEQLREHRDVPERVARLERTAFR